MDPVDGPRHRAAVTRRLPAGQVAAAAEEGAHLRLGEMVRLGLRALEVAALAAP
jgi:hypothetical protein